MKKVEILIPTPAFDSVKLSLLERFNCEIGAHPITVHSKETTRTESYRGATYCFDSAEKTVVSLKIGDELLPDLFATVGRVMVNGKFGDWEMTQSPVVYCGRTGWGNAPGFAQSRTDGLHA